MGIELDILGVDFDLGTSFSALLPFLAEGLV
jgi:hypothetical protein